MTTKHEIEIPDLPDGWRAVAYRVARHGIDHVLRNGQITIYNGFSDTVDLLIVEKIKPCRVVFEETDYYHEPEDRRSYPQMFQVNKDTTAKIISNKIWRIVEEE